MNIGFEYIKYFLNAKGRHDVHSPFVYDFMDKCQKIKIPLSEKKAIRKLVQTLKKDRTIIHVNDLGAGSKKLKTKRTIQQIISTNSSIGKYAQLLFKISCFYAPNNILELGTSLGIGSIHLAKGNPNAVIDTVEGCHEIAEAAKLNIKQLGCSNIQIFNQSFDDFISTLDVCKKYDLIFIDGNHDGTAVLNYLSLLDPFIHDETILILDDIRWSNSMFEMWNNVIQNEKYHVCIDLFRMGILVKRSHQMKEHFIQKVYV